jgi:hypothetical protein
MALEKKVDSKNARTITINKSQWNITIYWSWILGSMNFSNPIPRHGKR